MTGSSRTYAGATAQERTDERRRRLQDAVVRVVGDHGWAAATVRRVAAQAGVGPRFVYESHADVADLAERAYDDLGARLVGAAVTRLHEHDDPAVAVRAAVSEIVEALFADATRARFLLSDAPALAARRADLVRAAAREYARQVGTLDASLDAGRAFTAALFAAGGGLQLVRARLDGVAPATSADVVELVLGALDVPSP